MPRELFVQVASMRGNPNFPEMLESGPRTWFNTACSQSPKLDSLILTDVADQEGNLYTYELDWIVNNFARCFSNIFIGTAVIKWNGIGSDYEKRIGSEYVEGIANADHRWKNIYLSRAIADKLLTRYPSLYFNWYISYEANLNAFVGADVRVNTSVGSPISGYTVKEAYKAYLYQLSNDLYAKRPRAVLWSPTFWTPFQSLDATSKSQLQSAIRDVALVANRVNWLHFQDFIGQSSYVQCLSPSGCFPRVIYPIGCSNTVGYFNLLKYATTNTSIVSLRTNLEMMINKRINNQPTLDFIAADRNELAERVACYNANGVPIGASWEIRWWYRSYFASPANPIVYP